MYLVKSERVASLLLAVGGNEFVPVPGMFAGKGSIGRKGSISPGRVEEITLSIYGPNDNSVGPPHSPPRDRHTAQNPWGRPVGSTRAAGGGGRVAGGGLQQPVVRVYQQRPAAAASSSGGRRTRTTGRRARTPRASARSPSLAA